MYYLEWLWASVRDARKFLIRRGPFLKGLALYPSDENPRRAPAGKPPEPRRFYPEGAIGTTYRDWR